MARLPRYTIKNQTQHIIQLGRDSRQVFFEEQDYQYYHDCLDAAAYNYGLSIHAYALLPDHIHILATPGRSLLTCGRYIETNPVRAGLSKSPRDYPWSSYAYNALGKDDEMITPHREFQKLGANHKERARAYRALFKQKISDETASLITESTIKGWALGDTRFVHKIEKLSGRRASQLPKGRPKGS
jgi:putative transposase